MRRETAYKLAGRRHGQHGFAVSGLEKERELRFAPLPPGQVDQALAALRLLPGLRVEPGEAPRCLRVEYSILDYSLEIIENALIEGGFHLESSLYAKLLRALIYFSEETQRHNLHSPERLIKQSNEVYVQAYALHPHGDHDETPPDLRSYK